MRQDNIQSVYNECRQLTQILWLFQYGRISTVPSAALKKQLVDVLEELERIFHPDVAYVRRSEVPGPQYAGLFVRRQHPSITLKLLRKKNLLKEVSKSSSTSVGAIFTTNADVGISDLLAHINQVHIMTVLKDAALKGSLIGFFKKYFHCVFKHAEVAAWMSCTFGSDFASSSHVSVVALTDEDLMDYASDLSPQEADAVKCLAGMSA